MQHVVEDVNNLHEISAMNFDYKALLNRCYILFEWTLVNNNLYQISVHSEREKKSVYHGSGKTLWEKKSDMHLWHQLNVLYDKDCTIVKMLKNNKLTMEE